MLQGWVEVQNDHEPEALPDPRAAGAASHAVNLVDRVMSRRRVIIILTRIEFVVHARNRWTQCLPQRWDQQGFLPERVCESVPVCAAGGLRHCVVHVSNEYRLGGIVERFFDKYR